jgi:hypothetical protein
MTKTLWEFPVPSTALLDGCIFEELPGRACAIHCKYEDDSGTVAKLRLLFDGVEAYKCTYYMAISAEKAHIAYDKVVDVGSSEWLSDINEQLVINLAHNLTQNIGELKHLMIYPDDGPCYEFICRTFQVEKETVPLPEI